MGEILDLESEWKKEKFGGKVVKYNILDEEKLKEFYYTLKIYLLPFIIFPEILAKFNLM